MTPEQLKASILQYAIQGKLVEQRAEEGTAQELYQQIQEEKQKLVKEGKIKKEKPLAEIKDDEIPFDIPESWKWVRLSDLVCKEIRRGKSPKYDDKGSAYAFAQKCNSKYCGIQLELALKISNVSLSRYNDGDEVQDEDIIINSTGTGTLGRIGFFEDKFNVLGAKYYPDSHVTIVRAIKSISARYLYLCLNYYRPYLESMGEGSTNQKELKPATINNLIIALPPLAEQHRIVAKIEELLPYVERYATAWEKLEHFNASFPENMKKSILQYAIQGKLVEQRPDEGNAEELYKQIQTEKQKLIKEGKIKKEKPLAEIKDDEIPFDIPESWKWVKMGHLYNIHSSKRVHAKDYTTVGVPFYRSMEVVSLAKGITPTVQYYISEEQYQGFINDNYIMPTNGDLLITCIGGSIGWTWIVDDSKFYYKDGNVVAFDRCSYIDAKYLYYWLNSFPFLNQVMIDVGGTAYNALTIDMLKNYLIPLPPLAEQHRIVAKIEELLPYCDKLKNM